MSLICVEGCLGVGKSTLVQRFAERSLCAPFYEEVEANPFLLDFYRSPKQYAVHVQYTFLLLQERQFRAAVQRARGNIIGEQKKQGSALAQEAPTTVICDFHPLKSLVFSSVVLQPEMRAPLTQLYHLLHIPQPDLIVYLKADEQTILARLRKRNDVYKDEVDLPYVTSVCRAYDIFFRTYTGPIVTIDTTHIDYLENPKEISTILQEIPLLFAS